MNPLPILQSGVKNAEVGNWQRFLNAVGCLDPEGLVLKDDEGFGKRTTHATKSFQNRHNLASTGIVDALTRKQAITEGFIPFVPAQHASVHFPFVAKQRRLIVIHTMENSEKPYQAESVALWFGGRSSFPAPRASCHYCVDEDSIVQCVRDTDDAWHAGPVNGYSIGIEHAGFAKQTLADWEDAPSRAILWRSAKLVAGLCKRFSIPISIVTTEALKADPSVKGICGHVNVTNALQGGKGHYDPGPNFPWLHYIDLVRSAPLAP